MIVPSFEFSSCVVPGNRLIAPKRVHGSGNMAQAMAEGFLRTGALNPEQVYACARRPLDNSIMNGTNPYFSVVNELNSGNLAESECGTLY